MITRAFLVVALAATVRCAAVAEEPSSERDPKLFPVVQIVTFENGPCTAGTGERGTCYSQKECETLQGSASGTCANGFGVCCVLQATCDGTISVNGTYFTNPGYPSSYASPGMCSVLLKPPAGGTMWLENAFWKDINCMKFSFSPLIPHWEAKHDWKRQKAWEEGIGMIRLTCGSVIEQNNSYFVNPGYPSFTMVPTRCTVAIRVPPETCQILIDFDAFNLMGPVEGECGNDTFVVMGANPGSTVPVLCGDNSGQHIYLDVDNTNDPIQLIVTNSANSYGRQWKAGITFIGENDPCKAPPRCLQYHKNTAGSIMSFNYGSNPMMLTNQLYSICFGYVPGYCDIGLNFDRFDLGNINQACENDYLAIGGQQHCGDYSPYTAQANATGPIAILVASDSDNSREEEGFSGNYMMMPC